MHRRPETVDDAVALARERFLPVQAPDGRGAGRTAYAVRLLEDGTLVGTSALLEAHLVNESIHLGSTLYGRPWWGTCVNPEAKPPPGSVQGPALSVRRVGRTGSFR